MLHTLHNSIDAVLLLSTKIHTGVLLSIYRQISNMIHAKPQNLDVSRLVLQFHLCSVLKLGVKSRG